jgi:hypothetical protein
VKLKEPWETKLAVRGRREYFWEHGLEGPIRVFHVGATGETESTMYDGTGPDGIYLRPLPGKWGRTL